MLENSFLMEEFSSIVFYIFEAGYDGVVAVLPGKI